MRPVQHPKASVGLDGALRWFSDVRKAWRGELGVITTHDAARALGRAAAAKRERDNRTYAEKKADKLAQLRAERDGGWPVSPALINKELAR